MLPSRENQDCGDLLVLSVDAEEIDEFCSIAVELRSLRELYLTSANVGSIPACIFSLTTLVVLDLEGNRLRHVPDQISALSRLEELNLRSNELQCVNPAIAGLACLRGLELSDNQLETIPPELGRLGTLQVLGLSQNRITAVPSAILALPCLTDLYLYNNPLCADQRAKLESSAIPSGRSTCPAAVFQDFTLIARYTGMRRSEIAAACAEDIRVFRGTAHADAVVRSRGRDGTPPGGTVPARSVLCIYVADRGSRQTKTGHERVVPVADRLLPAIRRCLQRTPSGPLFPTAAADGAAGFGRRWLKAVARAHRGLSLHGFRHYATSEMENAGVSTGIACTILGHALGTVHDLYFHRELRAMKAAVDRIY